MFDVIKNIHRPTKLTLNSTLETTTGRDVGADPTTDKSHFLVSSLSFSLTPGMEWVQAHLSFTYVNPCEPITTWSRRREAMRQTEVGHAWLLVTWR